MKLYVAGKWEEKPAVREAQKALAAAGHLILSVWVSSKNTTTDRGLMQQALLDYSSLTEADALVLILNNEDAYLADSPNRYVEMGIALGRRIPIMIVGVARVDEIFHRLPWISFYNSIEELPIMEVVDAIHRPERP